jgi:ATPase subunit of ABC transporter with duplicated ATPase domains
MGTISLRKVGVNAAEPLFSNLDFTIGDNDRLALVAGNGRGKTTLMRCLAGLAEPSTGDIVRSRGLTVAAVEQDAPAALLDKTWRQILDAEDWRIEMALDEFSVPEALRDRPLAELSGGWRRLALISRASIADPDLLLLDEPTNDLDLEKLLWLETWLRTLPRGTSLVITSHDRDFLDAVTDCTLFLRAGVSHYFALPYSRARAALEEADATAEAEQNKALNEAARLRRQAAKLTNIGINSGSDLLTRKSKQLRDRAGRIEDNLENLHRERSGDIRLGDGATHARVLLSAENVAVAAPDGSPLFRIGKLMVFQGDRIVILGANGTGKSQFLQLVRRAISEPGSVTGCKATPSLELGYAEQDMAHLPRRRTSDELVGEFGLGNQRNRALLAGAGFPIEKQTRPVAELSPGQRARLAMLVLRLAEPNFYLLDEPTNHLDITGIEALESEIIERATTAIIVSHDRRFVRTVGTRFLVIERGKLNETDDPEPFLNGTTQG